MAGSPISLKFHGPEPTFLQMEHTFHRPEYKFHPMEQKKQRQKITGNPYKEKLLSLSKVTKTERKHIRNGYLKILSHYFR